MRAIIIEEDRFLDMTAALELRAEVASGIRDNTAERMGWPQDMWESAIAEARRQMHYEFVRWAQSHGASCVRR